MSDKYTPGPWTYDKPNWRGERASDHNWHVSGDRHEDEEGSVLATAVAVVVGSATSGGIAEANARRIVACVNACKGIDTATLEAMPPSGLADTRANLSAAVGQIGAMADKYADLAASHARLLAACEAFAARYANHLVKADLVFADINAQVVAAVAAAPKESQS